MGQLLGYKCEIELDSSKENGKTVVGSGTRGTRGTRGTSRTSRVRGTSRTSRVKTVDDG